MSACEVCDGDGRYPVINRFGREIYSIQCPECSGTGAADMVERVARAKWEVRRKLAAAWGIELDEWGDGKLPKLNGIMDEARAAIEAMMQPTEEMLDARFAVLGLGAEVEWRNMIQAALTETPKP